MKLHLPVCLFCALMAMLAPKSYADVWQNMPSVSFTGYTTSTPVVATDGAVAQFYNNDEVTISNNSYSSSGAAVYLYSGSALTMTENKSISITNNSITPTSEGDITGRGAAIYGYESSINIDNNGTVNLTGNHGGLEYNGLGGAIFAEGDSSSISLSANDVLNVSDNGVKSETTALGGAIYAGSNLNINDNGEVSFYTNSAISFGGAINANSYGGAIYAGGELSLINNVGLSFNENSANYGGAIFAFGVLTISASDDVSFSGNNSANSTMYSGGGAIYAKDEMSISGNVDVSFSENSSSSSEVASYGGAIYAQGLTISNNEGNVSFSGNFSSGMYANGGAIYAEGAMTISDNGNVSFSENFTSSSSADYLANSYGGAIYFGYGVLTISDNADVSFTGNSANSSSSSDGGAIFTKSGLTISENGDVSFTGNSANSSAADGNSSGGAIYAGGAMTISNNADVSFTDNSANSSADSHSTGGAINAGGEMTISDNADVSFTGNYSTGKYANGGAIYAGGAMTISNNRKVTFAENYVSSTYKIAQTNYGGAIYTQGELTISENGDVSFTGNSSANPTNLLYASKSSYGGAIYAIRGAVTISNNGNVSFSDNGSNYGGAIYARVDVAIQGNDSVLFERNYEKTSGAYRLRSIYSRDGNMILSAKTGGNITFNDSVYTAGDTYINSDYTDADGNTTSAQGAVIFSGKYAEKHLNAILTDNNENRTAKAEEILNSQTSEIRKNVYVNGGSLQIVDGAVLKVGGDTVSIAEGSNATLAVSDAELVAENAKIEVGASATLQLSNGASITADKISIKDGATLALGDIAVTTSASDSMVAAYRLSSLNVINADLTFAAGSTLVTDGTGINMTEGSSLTFMATSEGEKVNLVFTLGTEYTEDSLVRLFSNVDIVKFLMDGEEVDTSLTQRASDFFTGDYINENTTLTYDRTTKEVYLQGISKVVPEPTTATLSLLALAALAARRRRR